MPTIEVKEEAKLTRLRVFRWNQKLRKKTHEKFVGTGLFMIVINNKFSNGVGPVSVGKSNMVYRFDIELLLSNDDIKKLLIPTICDLIEFLPHTSNSLVEEISNYLNANFRFDRNTLIRAKAPRTVIVAEVFRTRNVIAQEDYVDSNSGSTNVVAWFPGFSAWPIFPDISFDYQSLSDDEEEEYADSDYDTEEEEYNIEPERNYDPDLKHIVCTLRKALRVHETLSVKPIAIDEPLGLVQVTSVLSLQIIHRDKLGSSNELVDTCPVCLEAFSMGTGAILKTLCSHTYHEKCIKQWLVQKHCCPICRFMLP